MRINQIKDFYKSIFKSSDKPCLEKHIQEIIDLDDYLPFNSTFFCVMNSHTLEFEYVSKNFKACVGLDPDMLKAQGMRYYWSRIHPDDLKIWINALDYLMEFTLNSIDREKRKRTNYTWNYRFKNANDVYVNIIQNTNPLAFDSKGKPTVGFAHCIVLDPNINIDISASVKYLNDYNEYETIFFKNFSQKLFNDLISDREREIVHLLALNYSSKEISEKLNISPHTVDTHRRNILKKLNVSSTGELIGMLKANKNWM
jgi:DNA-binding CsgD family transcriptional regulator